MIEVKNNKHPRPLTPDKLTTQLNNHRTADGNRDRNLIGTLKEPGIIRKSEALLKQKFPTEFIGISIFGSRSLGYAIPGDSIKDSDYDMLVCYDRPGDVYTNAQFIRDLKSMLAKQLTDCNLTLLPVNLNRDFVNGVLKLFVHQDQESWRYGNIKNLRSLFRAVFGNVSGRLIGKYRERIARQIKALFPNQTERLRLIELASYLIVDSELHPNSANKLITRHPSINASDPQNIDSRRQTLWKKRIARYLA